MKKTFLALLIIPISIYTMAQSGQCPWHQSKGIVEKIVCEGQSSQMGFGVGTVGAGGIYEASTGETNGMLTMRAPGIYWMDITRNGCTARDTVKLIWTAPPKLDFGADTFLCKGETLLLDAGNPGSQYLWNGGDTGRYYLVDRASTYSVRVQGACTTYDTINVYYRDTTRFSLGPDKFICQNQTMLLDPLITDQSQVTWQDGSTTPVYTATHPGTYSITMKNNCGTQQDTILLKDGGNCMIYVPDAFTPNRDGKNDRFGVLGMANFSFFHLQVFNRWGQQVFASNNPAQTWDGLFKSIPQPAGVYIWQFNYQKDYETEKTNLNGRFLLIR